MANLKMQDKFSELSKNSSDSLNLSEISLENASGDSKLLPTSKKDSTSDPDEVKVLKAKVVELETRCSNLSYENEQTNLDLAHEKHRVMQLERKLQFVKDNQMVFEKLREAYISMKYNEATGRKLVEIRDKSVQTWEGVLCRACLDTEKLRAKLERAKALYNGCVVIKKEEMVKISRTIEALKNHVNNEDMYCKLFSSGVKDKEECNDTKRVLIKRFVNSRSQSCDRGYFNRKKTINRKNKCKISKSLVDVEEVSYNTKRLH